MAGHQSPGEDSTTPFRAPKLTLFPPKVPSDSCTLVRACCLCRKDLAGPFGIPPVPGRVAHAFSRSHATLRAGRGPGITLDPPFLMGRLRPREVEQHLEPLRQPSGAGSPLSQVSADSGFWAREWVFRPGKSGWWPSGLAVPAPHGCPRSKTAGSVQRHWAPRPGISALPCLPFGLAHSWRSGTALGSQRWPLLYSHLSHGSLSSHCLPDSLLAPGRPLTSPGVEGATVTKLPGGQ